MTLAAAYRSLNRVVVMSDSLITNRDAPRPNAIPGRLKAVVVDTWLTVAYAGLSSQALDCIRGLRRKRIESMDGALVHLSACSKDCDGEVEFIVCAHESGQAPRLAKIRGPVTSEGEDTYWIGDPAAAHDFFKLDLPTLPGETDSEYYTLEERRFSRRFHELVRTTALPSVGGLVVEAVASPLGHCYTDTVAVVTGPGRIPDPLSPELRSALNRSGTGGYYQCAVLSAPDRGKAVVGMYFEQAGIGFIHAPLTSDDPAKVVARSQVEFQSLVAAHSTVSP